jgi:cytochrome c biogenesis protein
MMVGFYMTFFMSHRRVWVRIMEKKRETQVEMTGSSHRNRSEFEKEMDRIGQAAKEAVSSEKTKKSAAGGPSS